jgi:hypothetical protein
MAAVRQDIRIEEGANFLMTIDVSGYAGSLSGATALMQVRLSRDDDDVLLETTPSVNEGTQQVIVNVPYADTEDLAWRTGEYDVELTIGSERYRLVEGRVTVSPQVTRS